jgi:hypothetical protein
MSDKSANVQVLPKAMTDRQRELARHALGLPNQRRTSYRNRFCTGPGCTDYDNWCEMVEKGFARRRAGSVLTGGDDLFSLTRAGAEVVLMPGETLCPEDFPTPPTRSPTP